MVPRLGINIDHIATLRQARGESYPSLARGADQCFAAGAEQLTIHLREDRRHIQDADVEPLHEICKKWQRPLNFEMGCAPEIVKIAITNKPEWICLVPEKREEKTTEGGLDLMSQTNFKRVQEAMAALKDGIPNVKISLFLEANMATLEKAKLLKAEAVEVHTGDFARAFLTGTKDHWYPFIEQFKKAQTFLNENKIGCHAGHGLTLESVKPLLEEKLFVEYNIGHWIISEAVYRGLSPVVKDLKELFQGFPV